MKKPRMTGVQMSHLGVLLWMEYKPSEIAEEIKCNTDTVYKSYIPAGCPHRRDEEGNIWIVGTEFAVWRARCSSAPMRARRTWGATRRGA